MGVSRKINEDVVVGWLVEAGCRRAIIPLTSREECAFAVSAFNRDGLKAGTGHGDTQLGQLVRRLARWGVWMSFVESRPTRGIKTRSKMRQKMDESDQLFAFVGFYLQGKVLQKLPGARSSLQAARLWISWSVLCGICRHGWIGSQTQSLPSHCSLTVPTVWCEILMDS